MSYIEDRQPVPPEDFCPHCNRLGVSRVSKRLIYLSGAGVCPKCGFSNKPIVHKDKGCALSLVLLATVLCGSLLFVF